MEKQLRELGIQMEKEDARQEEELNRLKVDPLKKVECGYGYIKFYLQSDVVIEISSEEALKVTLWEEVEGAIDTSPI